jgi:hypothetical protein
MIETRSDPETEHRLATIEALLRELIDKVDGRGRRALKRARSVGQAAYISVISDPNFKPTELQIAAARSALRRSNKRNR